MHADTLQRSADNKNFKRSDFFTSLKLKKRMDHLFKSGGKAFGKSLMLRFDRSKEVDPSFQVVFAVSRKLGDAHVRNRIKRRLREALFHLLKQKTVKQSGFELAIIPKKEVADIEFSDLVADLQSALKRLPKNP
ncbi:ribonuclease P protein component [Turneriella parva]|uniref:Ribonuclease P protein component n=1 Tax=Turneriella parva (strain ATCC BAA-1111 / DSM 21527 / NCTC 11395 / H) TaxID=869212 RepID=I4B490_TURPD|nr:ribonuclease P protein component [Turneriella parva]AFM12097.1 ribonuclease P protein component [Turneriella parva DSM 21527]